MRAATSRVRTPLMVFALLGALALTVGCVTPSVPIPPPELEAMSFDVNPDDGFATFEYAADTDYSLATVYIFNRSLGEGIITTASENGSVGPTSPFPAETGHNIVISFETEDQLVTRCVELREGTPAIECQL